MNKSVSLRIPVFGPNTPQSLPADYYVVYAEAKKMVVQGIARFINRCRAIQLVSKDPAPKVRDTSCNVKERVIHDYVQEKPYAVAIVEAWEPTHTRAGLIRKVLVSAEAQA